jgi:hypothetical protein
MKSITISLVVGCGLLACGSVARAQAAPRPDQQPRFAETLVVTATPKTGSVSDFFLTFSGPVAVPGVSLAPGTYLFRFPAEGSKIIQVLKADRSDTYAMFHTINIEKVNRKLSSSAHDVTWRERRPDAPPAIKGWFLPGQTIGYEFIYPKEAGSK